jgi:hypothetical protein
MKKVPQKNTAQEILDLVIKISFYDEFDDCMSERGKTLIRSIRNSHHIPRFKAERSEGKTVIKWRSFIGEDVAFYANKNGFCIEDVHLYKASSKHVKILFKDCEKSKNFADKRLLENEVEMIKQIFVTYSKDIMHYFKKEDVQEHAQKEA